MERDSKEKIKKYICERKTEICIIGGTVIAIGLGYFGYKYISKIKVAKVKVDAETSKQITKTVVKEVTCKDLTDLTGEMLAPTISDVICIPTIKTIDVREHLRNLPDGHHPSALKLTEASNLGIELLDNQTIVSSYSRCYAA